MEAISEYVFQIFTKEAIEILSLSFTILEAIKYPAKFAILIHIKRNNRDQNNKKIFLLILITSF